MIQESSQVQEREIVPGFHGKFFHGDQITLAHWHVKAGSELPDHSHPHEQFTTVISGQFKMTVDGQTRTMEPGDVAVIQGNQSHCGVAITDCHLVDAFSPVREDYR